MAQIMTFNWLAILVSFLVVFASGAIWFGPRTFFPVWWKAMGRDVNEKPGGENMGLVFGLTALGQFALVILVAMLLNVAAQANGSVDLVDGLMMGLTAGFIGAAASLSHRMFAGHGVKVWLIEVSNDVINMIIVGVILSLWR